MNALTLMHARYGHETTRYWDALNLQWQFITRHQVDPKFGGWYATVSKDGKPTPGSVKSDQWTEAYHQGRALMQVSHELRVLASGKTEQAAK